MHYKEFVDSWRKNLKLEMRFHELLVSWQENHGSEDYDTLQFYTTCADILQEEMVQYHCADPDPFDDRHPKYVQPGCMFGKLLAYMGSYNDLLQDLVEHLCLKKDGRPSPLAVAAARFMLTAKPGLNMNAIRRDTSWLVEHLQNWVRDADEPLRTYATGLLVGPAEPQITNNNYFGLITTLLQRLWKHLRPDSEPPNSKDSKPSPKDSTIKARIKSTVNDKVPSNSKRKLSDASVEQVSKKMYIDRPLSKVDKSSQCHSRSISESTAPSSSWMANILDNDASNSSWSERMSFVIGGSYDLRPPLSSSVCQRFILDFLKCFGEYQDLLSIFLEHKALDIVSIYLKERKSDDLLTFKALEFLASLLCHNKVATDFIELDGVQSLLTVQRPSMGSTGVAMCLYYLAYRKDAMERVCQLPHAVLAELVKYAVWLLECSHESGRSHAALFFSISFSFRVILALFDQVNALRCLVNMISTSQPIVDAVDENADTQDSEEDHLTLQASRTVCSALKKYFEAHLVMKIFAIQRFVYWHEDKYVPVQSIPKYKSIGCSRQQFFEHLEFLVTVEESDPGIYYPYVVHWPQLVNFIELDGLPLLLKVIDLARDWVSSPGRFEVVRSVLDVVAVLTLSPKVQTALCEPHLLSSLNCDESGIEIILDVADGGSYFGREGEAQKSALAAIVNCVCGYTTDGLVGKYRKGSVQRRVSMRNLESSQEAIWKCVQNNNGIKILTSLLIVTDPAQQADDLRYLACKALLGLSNYKPVTQIISKLPFFASGHGQSIAREPVLHDRKRQHAKFTKCLETLVKRVSGGPGITSILDFETVRRSHIIAETHMQFNNKEVLQMVHNHLVWSGLHGTAEMLVKESKTLMNSCSPIRSESFKFPSPYKQKHSALLYKQGDHSGTVFESSSHGQKNRRISFSRGSHASAETPSPSSVINVLHATPSKKTKSWHKSGQFINENPAAQSKYKLDNNGVITTIPDKRVNRSGTDSPVTLNGLIEEHFKHRHARCRNPVVTVPEFSLFKPHCCPEPRYRREAPFNVAKRFAYRQGTCPRWGGIGGASCDRQLVYSRFRSTHVFKDIEDRKVSCSSVAFLPNDDRLLIGDYRGDLAMYNRHNQEEQVAQGLAEDPIKCLRPSHDGQLLLVVADGVWNTTCSMFSLSASDNFVQKATYEEMSYVEFSKQTQDKVIGTREHEAVVFDAQTARVLDVFECSDMASNYTHNRATFSYTDDLILSDGLLWDVRRPHTRPIHKFDKFNTALNGIFHPTSFEVVINTEVWDLRNFHLLHFVPALEQCALSFNKQGNVLYAVKTNRFTNVETTEDDAPAAFRTLDAYDYKQLAFVGVRHQIYDMAVDSNDRNIAVIETEGADDTWDGTGSSVCKLYEIGIARGDDDEEESNFGDQSVAGSESSVGSNDRSSSNSSSNGSLGLEEISVGSTNSNVDEDEEHGSSLDEDGWESMNNDSPHDSYEDLP